MLTAHGPTFSGAVTAEQSHARCDRGNARALLVPLREVAVAKTRERRRWFSDNDFDLIVWFDSRGAIKWFELCYDRSAVERALTWTPTHAAFVAAAGAIEPTVRSFVVQRLQEFTAARQSHEHTLHTDPPPPERILMPRSRNDEEPPAWRPVLIAAVIAAGVALAVWLLSGT